MSNIVVTNAPADGLIPPRAEAFAGTVTEFWARVST